MYDTVLLKKTADQLRLDVVKMVHDAHDGHPGPALSAMDMITALYYNVMRIDPNRPDWEDRDRFILSKGHACPALYAALGRKGYFSADEFDGLRKFDRMLQGHPTLQKTPGLDMTSGSLGNGLSIASGMALAAKYKNKSYKTYVILGDGEIEEGIVWEAAMFAKKHKLDNLIAFVDQNGWQSGSTVEACSGLCPIKEKWEIFGWDVQETDGHDFDELLKVIGKAQNQEGKPHMIIAKTVKGKGLDFMENDNSWHKRVPDDDQLKRAAEQLGGNGNDQL